jgi:hypothetical protein
VGIVTENIPHQRSPWLRSVLDDVRHFRTTQLPGRLNRHSRTIIVPQERRGRRTIVSLAPESSSGPASTRARLRGWLHEQWSQLEASATAQLGQLPPGCHLRFFLQVSDAGWTALPVAATGVRGR